MILGRPATWKRLLAVLKNHPCSVGSKKPGEYATPYGDLLTNTNACIRLLNRSSSALVQRFRETPPSRVRLCAVVKAELLYGARKSHKSAENLQKLKRFFAPIKSLPFDDACAEQAGQIRAELESNGTPLGPWSLRIPENSVVLRNSTWRIGKRSCRLNPSAVALLSLGAQRLEFWPGDPPSPVDVLLTRLPVAFDDQSHGDRHRLPGQFGPIPREFAKAGPY